MDNRNLAARNAMVDWQDAPADYQIANYDLYKFRYRAMVERMLEPVTVKSLKTKTFVTISTNVLCADLSSRNQPNPIDNDIYQPLEIALAKWSMSQSNKPRPERIVATKHWIINPLKIGDETFPASSPSQAMDHELKHKIKYNRFRSDDIFIENDLDEIIRQIKEFLTSDWTVFSSSLKHCRQDLGCLKWLNKYAPQQNLKPVKVFSAEDLYVVLLRKLFPEGSFREFICNGVAILRCGEVINLYDEEIQCSYHNSRRFDDPPAECGNCAKALAISWPHAILEDYALYISLLAEDNDELNRQMGGLNVNEEPAPGP